MALSTIKAHAEAQGESLNGLILYYNTGEKEAIQDFLYNNTFTGWNTAKNGTGTAYKPGDTPQNLTTKQKGTVTLYAQWEQSK